MRRAISCVTWLPKSRIRTRSVMRPRSFEFSPSFSFPFRRASFDQDADIGPGIGHLMHHDLAPRHAAQFPFPAGDAPPAQLRVEAAEGIQLQRPEMEIGVARLGKPARERAEQPRADAPAIAPGPDIDGIDLGG